jgi:hypothetical protein
MDIYFFIQKQIDWARKAFPSGIADHRLASSIRSVVSDIEEDFETRNETSQEDWIHIILMGIEGAYRTGLDANGIVTALKMMQNRLVLMQQRGTDEDPHATKALNATPERKF